MATQLTTQTAAVPQRRNHLCATATPITHRSGAHGLDHWRGWVRPGRSLGEHAGGPEMAPGGCGGCHQGPVLGSVTLDFTGQTV